MLTSQFEIVLTQPLIISQQAASAGAHQSLDYIPGSVLLGLVASRLYARLDADSAWTVFHSGRIRFGDALPLSDNREIGYPMPLCLHGYKGEGTRKQGYLIAESLFDPSRGDTDSNRQSVQLRSGYTTGSGLILNPTRQQTLKTAIDCKTGMAAESQLFGYEALSAGQRYRFTLSADADFSEPLWQEIQTLLAGVARLGRSRSAQFGQVHIEPLASRATLSTTPGADSTLTLWLLSDLLLEEDGQPCLIPRPHLLGLPEGSQWLNEHSFLRSRRYSAYNAYRRHYDSERQVICRGSVLRYELQRPLAADEADALQQGLGLQIESGLGAVWINPPMLEQVHPKFSAAFVPPSATLGTLAQPDTPLLHVLALRRQRRVGDIAPEAQALTLFKKLLERIYDARRYAALSVGVPLATAPGRSQWGRFKELASDHRNNPAALWTALTNERDGMLRARSGWGLRYGTEPGQKLDTWMREALTPYHERDDFSRLIGHLAVLGLQKTWLDCCAGINEEHTS